MQVLVFSLPILPRRSFSLTSKLMTNPHKSTNSPLKTLAHNQQFCCSQKVRFAKSYNWSFHEENESRIPKSRILIFRMMKTSRYFWTTKTNFNVHSFFRNVAPKPSKVSSYNLNDSWIGIYRIVNYGSQTVSINL